MGVLNKEPGGCFINVSRALQNNLPKIDNARNHIYSENSNLKLCVLGTRTKFQIEILIRCAIPAIHKFRENILESSRNVSETTPNNGESAVMLWHHHAHPGHVNWTNIGSGNGLLPNGNKSLPEPMSTHHHGLRKQSWEFIDWNWCFRCYEILQHFRLKGISGRFAIVLLGPCDEHWLRLWSNFT